MASQLSKRAIYICQPCLRSRQQHRTIRQFSSLLQQSLISEEPINSRPTARRKLYISNPSSRTFGLSSKLYKAPTSRKRTIEQPSNDTTTNPVAVLSSIQNDISQLESATKPPKSKEILELLERCHKFADLITYGSAQVAVEEAQEKTQMHDPASSTLQALDEHSKSNPSNQSEMSLSFREKASNMMCELVYDLMKDPKVFINPQILASYTKTQILLGKPEYLPEIFYLYANKPIPQPNSSPIQYKKSWADMPKNAIPVTISDAALEAAILKKDLPLTLAIIDTTVATQAFKRNKLIAKGSLPVLAWCSIPATAYAGAQWLSEWQNTWDPSMIKWMTMAGSMAYVGTLTIIGFVAFSTWNDHHERVRWQPGIRLRDRWIKEEERLYFDRIALAWGFQSKIKRGEEQGEEWDALRESIMLRGMVLDQSDLIEGMNP